MACVWGYQNVKKALERILKSFSRNKRAWMIFSETAKTSQNETFEWYRVYIFYKVLYI